MTECVKPAVTATKFAQRMAACARPDTFPTKQAHVSKVKFVTDFSRLLLYVVIRVKMFSQLSWEI